MRETSASVVLCAHREGVLLQKSWRSLQRSRQFAERVGVSVDVVLVLDRPDQETRRVAAQLPGFRDRDRRVDVDSGDVGLSRNAGNEAATGEWVGVLDGDDCVSENWIAASVAAGRSLPAPAVIHPEWVVHFEGASLAARHRGDDDPIFQRNALLAVNPWNACSFASRRLRSLHPYRASDVLGSGFGHEDWLWHCETIAAGVPHRVAAGTLHCVRIKRSGSLNAAHHAGHAIVRPNALFEAPPR